jgi:transcriptional regulator with XRE-family HTH domain
MMTTSEARDSLSLKLKNARKARRISVQKLAKLMHVPDSTIDAMESQGSGGLPLTNLVGLTNRYVKEVGLDPTEISEELQALKPRAQTKTHHSRRTPGSRIFVASRASVALIAGIFLSIILGYAAWQAWQLTAAPRLVLSSPAGNVVTDNPEVKVTGSANVESSVMVNGSNISLADDGTFEAVIYLQPGQNFVQVRAINALGHEAVEDRLIVYRP